MTGAPTILVIEDDEQVARVISEHLRAAGYRTLAARDGVTGLALARRGAIDLITLDMIMAPLDGRTVLRRRADTSTASIPVVVVTVVDRHRGEPAAEGYVSKPFRGRRLLAEVGRLVAAPGG